MPLRDRVRDVQRNRELFDPFGQYCSVSDMGASRITDSDAVLIGDSVLSPEIFGLIVERHATSVFRYLASRLDRSNSEDLLAEVFETAFRARQRYDSHYDGALPWLLGIANNLLRHHRRSEIRNTSLLFRLTQARARRDEEVETEDVVAVSVELKDQMQTVRRALDALDERHREVLVLSAGLGLGYEDIARTLGINVGTVRSRLSRARTRLRELLGAGGQYTVYAESSRHGPVPEERTT